MAEKFFPFDAVEVSGEPDRVYFAADFAEFFSAFVGNGVYPNPSTNLQVLSLNNNMVLTVKTGRAMINGYGYVLTEDDLKVQINTADSSYNRKDIIVVSLNLVDRNIKVKYKPGTPSSNPQEPELIRTSDIFELKLAIISVRSGTQQILQSDITDTRLNKSVCGIVTNVVKEVDASTLFNQYQSYLEQKIQEWNETKQQQGNDWQSQMQEQQQGFEQQKSTINGWYESVKANIALLKTFDFDNIAELAGAKRTTSFKSNGSIEEGIVIASSGKKIATRTTSFESNGNIVQLLIVFGENGTSELKRTTITTSFKDNGNIEEVVS